MYCQILVVCIELIHSRDFNFWNRVPRQASFSPALTSAQKPAQNVSQKHHFHKADKYLFGWKENLSLPLPDVWFKSKISALTLILWFLCARAQFSISLKTHSSHGMICYVSDQKETNFLALFVAHGRLIFMFNAGHQKIRIKSQEKYNDGLWHNVSKSKQSWWHMLSRLQ